MTTLAEKIHKLEDEIEVLKGKRNDLLHQRDKEQDQAEQTRLDGRIDTISKEITATRNTMNLHLAAQLQGKLPLSFSFFPL